MTDRDSPVTADELHAYVDGMLPADRKAAVEAWLASHPDDAARVAEWRALAEVVRDRYGAVAEEPVPARFDLAKLDAPARAVARDRGGGGAGSPYRRHRRLGGACRVHAGADPSGEIITAEALSAHKLYIAEVRHPIEVRAAEQHLIPWLSKRVGTNLRVPDLKEYSLKLLGGRLLPGPIGPAALFMYESPNGERFTIYCSQVEEAAHGVALPVRRRGRGDALGRERDRLCRERARRSRPARQDRADRL